MSTGYWIVAITVGCAALAALTASMSELPEWRIPRRRLPLTMVYELEPRSLVTLDPLGAAWRSVLDTYPAAVPRTHEAQVRGDSAALPPDHGVDLNDVLRAYPNYVIVRGVPELVLAGEPFANVLDAAEYVVQRFAIQGCHCFVIGFGPFGGTPLASMASVDERALSSQARAWNTELTTRLSTHGASIVTTPELLRETVDDIRGLSSTNDVDGIGKRRWRNGSAPRST